MSTEKTFVMIKPDGIQRELVGKIINRFERKALKLIGIKLIKMTEEQAKELYSPHKGKSFYEKLIKFITSGPVLAMVWTADNAVLIARKLVGSTTPNEAQPGTIRGDFTINTSFNVIHASDSPENALRELKIFFKDDELVDYKLSLRRWLGVEEEPCI